MITCEEFDRLAAYAFSSANPGYKPTVREAPNGDGTWDEQKEYAHLAPKYFSGGTPEPIIEAWTDAMIAAIDVCDQLGLSSWRPGPDSTLRLLRYLPGATTAPHTDFDLFTLSLYRSHKDAFKYIDAEPATIGDWNTDRERSRRLLTKARELSPGIHFGELMTEILGVPATPHETLPLDEWSYSAVFFVIPDHAKRLPSGVTVGEWIRERVARSRKTV